MARIINIMVECDNSNNVIIKTMKRKRLYPINCHLCDGNNYKVLYKSTLVEKDFDPKIIASDMKNTLGNYKKHSRIVQCLSCGLVYTNPMEDFMQLLKGYTDVVDEEYLLMEKYRKILS